MPSDITGSSVFDQRSGDFEFRPGPVFTHLLLADEINRASPEDPGGAARGDAGTPGQHRRHHPPAGAAVPRRRDAEPGRVRGHLPAAGGAARPVPAAGRLRLPERVPTSGRCCRGGWTGSATRSPCRRSSTGRRCWRCRRRSSTSTSRTSIGYYMVDLVTATRTHASVQVGRQPARVAGPGAGRPGQGGAGRSGLRDPRGRQGRRRGRARSPDRAQAGPVGARRHRRRPSSPRCSTRCRPRRRRTWRSPGDPVPLTRVVSGLVLTSACARWSPSMLRLPCCCSARTCSSSACRSWSCWSSAWSSTARPRCRGRSPLPDDRLLEGDDADIVVTVRGRGPAGRVVIELLPPAGVSYADDTPAVRVVRLPANGSVGRAVSADRRRRGACTGGSRWSLRAAGPAGSGLVRRDRSTVEPVLRVLPSAEALEGLARTTRTGVVAGARVRAPARPRASSSPTSGPSSPVTDAGTSTGGRPPAAASCGSTTTTRSGSTDVVLMLDAFPVGRDAGRRPRDRLAGHRLPGRAGPGRAGALRHRARVGDAGDGRAASSTGSSTCCSRPSALRTGALAERAAGCRVRPSRPRAGHRRDRRWPTLALSTIVAGRRPGGAAGRRRGRRGLDRRRRARACSTALAYAMWRLELAETRERLRDRGIPVVPWRVDEPLAPVDRGGGSIPALRTTPYGLTPGVAPFLSGWRSPSPTPWRDWAAMLARPPPSACFVLSMLVGRRRRQRCWLVSVGARPSAAGAARRRLARGGDLRRLRSPGTVAGSAVRRPRRSGAAAGLAHTAHREIRWCRRTGRRRRWPGAGGSCSRARRRPRRVLDARGRAGLGRWPAQARGALDAVGRRRVRGGLRARRARHGRWRTGATAAALGGTEESANRSSTLTL